MGHPAELQVAAVLFSVAIPVFNRAELLQKTLASVWRQTFSDFELIVVDDGSTDGTLEYLRSLNGRVRVFAQPHKGPGTARTRAAKHAKGEYLAFLDSDDLWFPWTLKCFAEVIKKFHRPAFIAGNVLDFHNEVELASIREMELQADGFMDYLASHENGYFAGAGMSVIRRDELLKTGGYTEQPINAEDHDLALRLGNSPGFVQIISPVTVGWRRHSGSITQNLQRSIAGSFYLIKQESRGCYPGGHARRIARRQIITRHIRPVLLACLREGKRREAWELYRATLSWHVRLGRVRFLTSYPPLAVFASFRSALRNFG